MRFFINIVICYLLSITTQAQTLDWQLLHPIQQKWLPFGSSGTVQQVLMANGELPDPLYAANEKLFAWIEQHQWVFTAEFSLSENDLQYPYLDLVFPCIDTYADIYVNDSLMLRAENAFKPYRLPIATVAKLGVNKIRAVFTPPVLYHANRYQTERFHYPAPNDAHATAIAPLCRKPQYQFGWDWALRINTIGFLSPVRLHRYHHSQIIGKNCQTITYDENSAKLDLCLFLSQDIPTATRWKSKLFGEVTLPPSQNKELRRSVTLPNPRLWWARGQGEPHLYHDIWTLYNEKGDSIDQIMLHFGVRKVELLQQSDQWGTSYIIQLNNRPVFCKGANYIPQDIFTNNISDEDQRTLVATAAESNFNMLRVWGGGYYPNDAFYNACDSMGIMVWQDFMFACSMYPADDSFIENLRGELAYQIPRIASHPCLALFNGNNEVAVAWKNWGYQDSYKIDSAGQKEVGTAYQRLFQELMPQAVAQFGASPYVHTSPLSNWGKDENFNHSSMHYWGVWHGKDPLSDFAQKTGRFNAEYGFQSFPEYSTLLRFADKKDWDLQSETMKHHQKSYVGNAMIERHATEYYGKAKDFEEFVYFSQLTQAKAMHFAISAHRIDMPRCMGTLYWQLNDCWGAPTWSSIDYYGNWKAAHYTIQQDFADVAILSKRQTTGKEDYFLVSDAPETFTCRLEAKVYDTRWRLLKNLTSDFLLKQGTVQNLGISTKNNKDCMLHFKWNDAAGNAHERWFFNINGKWEATPKAQVHLSLSGVNPTEKTAILTIRTANILRDFWVCSDLPGLHCARNFCNLPRGKHEIKISFEQLPTIEQLRFYWR